MGTKGRRARCRWVTQEDDGVSMVLETLSKEAQCPGNHGQSLRLMLLAVHAVIATRHVHQNLRPKTLCIHALQAVPFQRYSRSAAHGIAADSE